MLSIKKKYDNNDLILLHIPKTGGTTVKKILISNNFNFAELHFNSRMDVGASIMLDEILKSNKKIIVTFRNPIECVLSQAYFYQQYKHFKVPNTLNEYINTDYLQNSQIHFLTHNKFLEKTPVTEEDYKKIIKLINRRNTFCFILDEFNKSLISLKKFLNVDILEFNNVLNRYNFQKIPSYYLKLDEIIENFNSYDMKLYNKISTLNQKKTYDWINNTPIYNIPWFYPLKWFINKPDILSKHQTFCKNIHSNIISSNTTKITLKQYLRSWVNNIGHIFNNIDSTDTKLLDDILHTVKIILNNENPIDWILNEPITTTNNTL